MAYFSDTNAMRVYFKTHQTHIFLRVRWAQFRAQTLCLNPIGRTRFFLRYKDITADHSLAGTSITIFLVDGFTEATIL